MEASDEKLRCGFLNLLNSARINVFSTVSAEGGAITSFVSFILF